MVSWLGGKPIRISIRATVIAFFLVATIITASVAISLQYFFQYQHGDRVHLIGVPENGSQHPRLPNCC